MFLSLVIALYACSGQEKKSIMLKPIDKELLTNSKSKNRIQKCIAAHGGDLYDSAQYEFQFSELVNRFLIKKASTVMY